MINLATEELIATISLGSSSDVDAVVESAKKAFVSCSPTTRDRLDGLSTSAAAAGGSLMALEKTLRLESTERFPFSHREGDEAYASKGLLRREGDERTVKRRRKSWPLKCVPGDRGV